MSTASPLAIETRDRLRGRLLERRRTLVAGVDGLEEDLRWFGEEREPEFEEQGQEEALAGLLDRVREHDRAELGEIQRALAKIAAGVYGLCEGCGDPIAVARLEAKPEARCCIECEEIRDGRPREPERRFEPRAHHAIPAEYRDLDDAELAQAVRERLEAHGDPDLLAIEVRCHDGVVRLAGEIPSERQRQIVVQLVTDTMGLEVLDRLRVTALDREDTREGRQAPEGGEPVEERIPDGRGMRPLPPPRPEPPADESEAITDVPDGPIPEDE